jgi:hypothetical protein
MTAISEKDRFEYAWKHFSFISDQRIKTFHFYVILLTAPLAAMFSTRAATANWAVLMVFAFWNAAMALVFAIIDFRNRTLLGIAKTALVHFERSKEWRGHRLLLVDSRKQKRIYRLLSYTAAFHSLFLAQLSFAVGLVWSL